MFLILVNLVKKEKCIKSASKVRDLKKKGDIFQKSARLVLYIFPIVFVLQENYQHFWRHVVPECKKNVFCLKFSLQDLDDWKDFFKDI